MLSLCWIRNPCVLEEGGIDEIWKVSVEALEHFVSYIFDNLESFKLILCCASGTKYTEFTDWMVEREMKDMYKTYELLEKKGITVRRLPPKELHMLTHAYFSCIFETVLHNFKKKRRFELNENPCRFFFRRLEEDFRIGRWEEIEGKWKETIKNLSASCYFYVKNAPIVDL